MTKISTHLPHPAAKASQKESTPRPGRMAIERIRQFARAYTYIPAVSPVGGMILN